MSDESLKQKIPIGAVFRHYKGKKYKILSIGHHSEDHTMYVVYQGLYQCDIYGDQPVWVRPIHLFFETVLVDGREIPRFTKVDE